MNAKAAVEDFLNNLPPPTKELRVEAIADNFADTVTHFSTVVEECNKKHGEKFANQVRAIYGVNVIARLVRDATDDKMLFVFCTTILDDLIENYVTPNATDEHKELLRQWGKRYLDAAT